MTNPAPMKAQDLSTQVAWGTPDPFATITDNLGADWIAQPKIDGVRVWMTLGAEQNNVGTASHTYTRNLPHLEDIDASTLAGTTLDGELTWQGGMATGILNSNPGRAIRAQRTHKAVFHAFDVTTVNGVDVTARPYTERRTMLEMVVAVIGSDHVLLVPELPATPATITQALADGWEGVMLKHTGSRYHPGRRSPRWLKVKRTATADFIVYGSKPGEGRNTGKVGSMKVAWWDGHDLIPVGDVGGGLTDTQRDQITDPATGGLAAEMMGRVVEVAAQELTSDGRLRHPRFVRFRDDKAPTDCGREQVALFHTMAGHTARQVAKANT